MTITTKEQLVGTTWTFFDTIDFRKWQIVLFRVGFTSNGKYYNDMNCYNQSSKRGIWYENRYTTKEVIQVYDTTWIKPEYKTIKIDSVQDLQNFDALIDFLNLNTVEGGGTAPEPEQPQPQPEPDQPLPSQTSKAINLDNIRAFKSKCDLTYQSKLISGHNIKTVNGQSLLGQGNITIQGGGGGISENNDFVLTLNATDSAKVFSASTPPSQETVTLTTAYDGAMLAQKIQKYGKIILKSNKNSTALVFYIQTLEDYSSTLGKPNSFLVYATDAYMDAVKVSLSLGILNNSAQIEVIRK